MELERKKAALIRAGYYAMVSIVAVLAVRYLWGLLLPFLVGFLIAYWLRPVVGFISHHSKIGRRGAAIVSAIVFYAVIAALCWLLGALLFIQLDNAVVALPRLYSGTIQPLLLEVSERTYGFVGRFSPIAGANMGQIYQSVNAALENLVVSLSEWLALGVSAALKAVPLAALTVIFTILSSVLICVDYGDVTGFVLAQIPQRLHGTLLGVRDFLAGTILKILKAYLILMLITFAELAAGLWLLGVERFLLVAVVIAILDLLPVLGSGAVLIPWATWKLITGDYFMGGGLLVLWAVVSFARQMLEPRIVGGQLGLPPLVTLTAMYCGLRLAGFGGLILAPIVCLLIKYLHENDVIRAYKSPPAS